MSAATRPCRRHRCRLTPGIVAVAFAVTLTACAGSPKPTHDPVSETRTVTVAGGTYTLTDVERFARLLDEDEPALLVNVHVPYEGELPETDLHLAYNTIAENVDRLGADRDTRIALYCMSGRMSAEAAATLVGLGYTDVWDLDGGMIAWEAAGRPLVHR